MVVHRKEKCYIITISTVFIVENFFLDRGDERYSSNTFSYIPPPSLLLHYKGSLLGIKDFYPPYYKSSIRCSTLCMKEETLLPIALPLLYYESQSNLCASAGHVLLLLLVVLATAGPLV